MHLMIWNQAHTPQILPSPFTARLLCELAGYRAHHSSVSCALISSIGCFLAPWAAGTEVGGTPAGMGP